MYNRSSLRVYLSAQVLKTGIVLADLPGTVHLSKSFDAERLTEDPRAARHQPGKSASNTNIPHEVRPRIYCCKNIASNHRPVIEVVSIQRSRSPYPSGMGTVWREESESGSSMHHVRGNATSFHSTAMSS